MGGLVTSGTTSEFKSSLKAHPFRWAIVVVLVLLAMVSSVGAAIGRWTHTTLFDTDAWVEVVGPIGTDPIVTDALSEAVSDALIEWAMPTERLENILPDFLDPVAVEVGAEIETFIVEETTTFFESDLYEDLWFGINETAHRAVVAIIRDQVPFVSTAGGVVSVDLRPLAEAIVDRLIVRLESLGEVVPDFVIEQFEIDDVIQDFIDQYEEEGVPEQLGDVVIYESDRLASVQQAVATFDRLVFVMPLIALLFAVLAVVVAPSRLVMIPILVGAAAIAWLLSLLGINLLLDNIVSGITNQNAAEVADLLFTTVTEGLQILLIGLIVIAVLIAFVSGVVVAFARYVERDDSPGEEEMAPVEAGTGNPDTDSPDA